MKILFLILTLILCLCMLSGCVIETAGDLSNTSSYESELPSSSQAVIIDTNSAVSVDELDIHSPLDLYFSSGVGAWYSHISLNSDGTFIGNFHDSDMGDTAEAYPYGTRYFSEFSGNFTDLKKINDYTYSLTLETLITKQPDNTEYIEEGIRYIVTTPAGLERGKEFILYTPEAPTNVMTDELISCWPLREQYSTEPLEKLWLYGLYNVETGAGFFTWPGE